MIRCLSIALLALFSTTLAAAEEVYNEVYRPQFHFSPKKNWTNDPNGLVYYKATWHLFFQHNPKGIEWGNMKEIELLHDRTQEWSGLELNPGDNPLAETTGDLFDIQAELGFDPANTPSDFGFVLRGEAVKYDPAKKELSCLGATAPIDAADGEIALQLLLDRTTIEAFGNGGKVSMSSCFLPDPKNMSIGIYTNGAPITIKKLEVHRLKSSW